MNNDNQQGAPQAPAPVNPPLPPVQPGMPPSAPQNYPGKTLGIVGLILAIIANLIGLIISIVAFSQSKKAGYKNTPALVGIVLGAVLAALTTVLTIFIISTAVNLYSSCSQYIDSETAYNQCLDGVPMNGVDDAQKSAGPEVYENEQIAFSYPSDWKLAPAADNYTHFDTNGSVAYDWQNITYDTSVAGQYSAYNYGADEGDFTMEYIRTSMQTVLQQYDAATAKSVNASNGFGCANELEGFTFVDTPAYVEQGGLGGIYYTFECLGYSGKVKGAYYTAYDVAGNRHTLAGTVLVEESDLYFDELQTMVKSLATL